MLFNFLLCSERSGSNFIVKLLNSHSQICGPSPNHLIGAFAINEKNYGNLQNKKKNWNILINDLVNYLNAQMGEWKSNVSFDELHQAFPKGKIPSIIKYIFEKEAKKNNKSQLFIKENQLYNYFEWIESSFFRLKVHLFG